jgi:hypothetical protein
VSKFRVPHGTYVRNTPDWFDYRRLAGSAFIVASPANYSSVSLFNNATDGSTLHITGLTGFSTIAAAGIGVNIFQGAYGTLTGFAPVPVSPVQLIGPGVFYTNQTTPRLPVRNVWMMGGPAAVTHWPYDYALCILSAGQSLVCETNIVNADVTACFHWLVMGPAEGFF